MKTTSWVAAAVLLTLGLHAPASRGQAGQEPAGSFTGRIEVTAVEIMIEVRDRQGRTPAGLAATDFEVFEDGAPVPVIGLDYPPPPGSQDRRQRPDPGSGLPGAGLPGAGLPGQSPSEGRAWRFLVYFESVLSDPQTIRQAARTLIRQAPELTALGSVEVVVADPSPRVALPFSRDPERLRETLDALKRPRRSAGELAKIRRDFLIFRDIRLNLGAEQAAETFGQIRSAVQREQHLVERQLERFRHWLNAYGSRPASALILITDGFDLDPGEFYREATSNPRIEGRLATELLRFRMHEGAERMSLELSARGWTAIVFAPRGVPPPDAAADASIGGRDRFRSIGTSAGDPSSASPFSLLQRPTEPLLQLAEDSGGEVLTNLRKAAPALERLGQRLRLTYQAERPADGKLHRLEVRLKRRPSIVSGVELSAPRWTSSPTALQVARSHARRLLALDQAGEVPAAGVPVEAWIEFLSGPQKKGSQRARLRILFDLNEVRAVLVPPEGGEWKEGNPRVPIRFTVGVALAQRPPFVHQLTEEVELPATAAGRLPRFEYTVDLDLPPQAGRVAVVVEEPTSGAWGGNVARPRRRLEASRAPQDAE